MHMADALLNPAVGFVMAGVSAAVVGTACWKFRKDPCCMEKLPVLAMAGAFVFAAQMINFTIPGTGSSGHLCGGILLASLLSPWAAVLAITVVLAIQCLFFADGGLIALGCNIFNMGIIPCLIVYPLMRRVMERHPLMGAMGASLLALPLGAACVVLETTISGITALPTLSFFGVMIPIHLAIALGEGLATAAVITFVAQNRPQLLDLKLQSGTAERLSGKKMALVSVAAILLIGLGLSNLASSLPDGLEWSILQLTGAEELETTHQLAESAAEIQNATAVFPDYTFGSESTANNIIAAFAGLLMTLGVCGLLGWLFAHSRSGQTQN